MRSRMDAAGGNCNYLPKVQISILGSEKMKEEWRAVVGFEWAYIVSSSGRVAKLKTARKQKGRAGALCVKTYPGGVLHPYDNCGYGMVTLSREDKSRAKFLVHRLVAIAFIPNPENKPHINHKDGVKKNNAVSNLEWCTIAENNRHGFLTGLIPPMIPKIGEHCKSSKLTNEQVGVIKRLISNGGKCSTIALEYGVGRTTISAIKSGRNWAHL